MTYGKDYRILKNFNEYDDEESFEKRLRDAIGKDAVLLIDGKEDLK